MASASSAAALAAGCATQAATGANYAGPDTDNPLLKDWNTPFGVPDFANIKAEHYKPALLQGMTEQLAKVDEITAVRAAPSFDNTILALEQSSPTLNKVNGVFGNLTGSMNDEALQAVDLEMSPALARHDAAINTNAALYARVETLYAQRNDLDLTDEQKRLLERYYVRFRRAGAHLDEAQRARMAEIDGRLSELSTQFGQNMLADTAAWTMELAESDLAGLPPALKEAAAQAGRDRGKDSVYVITLQRSSVEPFLQYSERRDLRERAFNAWAARGLNGNEFDNRAIIREILTLRTERATLLGFATYADFQLDDRMARTPANAYDLMMRVWTPAVARANEEKADMQRMIDAEGGGFALQGWDWRYYAEKVRRARYDISDAEVQPYLEFDRILEGSFWVANRLFGLTFTPRTDIPKYIEDARTFEVSNAAGEPIGVYLADPYARPIKNSGAWMNSFRRQSAINGEKVLPVIVNCWNYNKPQPGQPTLLTWDDAETVLHEFGHALHGLMSNVTYPTLAGTAVARDYVEFPSQVMEHWVGTEDFLSRFARHHQTNEPMPAELIAKVRASKTFNQGFSTVEYLLSAIVDMDLHAQGAIAADFDVSAFEASARARINAPVEILLRHRPTHFSHIFNGGYAAGYYGYLWAEVLEADAYRAFEETGDVFNPEVAARFKEYIFSAGNLRPPEAAFELFRGRAATVQPLLAQRGFN
ncbi:MAG: peptidase M3 [Alphaproteobacteria bacterium]|nr:peptidase M3 [Alphaproteobacteria bacterium]